MVRRTRLFVAFFLILILAGLAGIAAPARAQAADTFANVDMEYVFGDQAVFRAVLQKPEGVKEVYLILQPAGEDARTEKISWNGRGEIQHLYNLKAHPLRPFAQTVFWFVAVNAQNQANPSPRFTFDYIDNRQTWQTLDNREIQVNWLEGDLAFGQRALDTASNAERTVRSLLPGKTLAGLKIYIYESAAHLQEALSYDATPWLAGEANPDLRIVLISVAPGIDQQVEMERQIPHELMHVFLYTIAQDNYAKIPIWLNEGLASISEMRPNTDYQKALRNAVKENNLTPIGDLCAAFPQDASDAYLAYAESFSFVKFLQNKFGNSSLLALVNAYNDRRSCEDGVQVATGLSLNQLDYRWRQETLGIDTGSLAAQNLAPYLSVVGVLIVVPILVIAIRARRPAREQTL